MRVLIDLQACQSPGGGVRGVGRYCMALCRAMVLQRGGHDVWVAVNGAMPTSAAHIRDTLADILPPDRIFNWAGLRPTQAIDRANLARASVAEHLREDAFEQFGADVVLTMSMVDGYGDDVVTSVRTASSALQAAIVFDLIPLHMPDVYLERDGALEWYASKLAHLAACDVLLGISDYTTADAVASLGVDASRVVNISAAVGTEFVRLPDAGASAGSKYGITKPFVMYAGGFDQRKNLVRLIEAYAALPVTVKATHQLVFVGKVGAAEKQVLQRASADSGLGPDGLVFTDYVSDHELIRLYNAAALYVFPSTHEGFGLPALEAMSCGAVVIGSNTTSLPEVMGYPEALFDPYSIDAIAASLLKGLTDETFRLRMREHALTQVAQFSWEKSASLAWGALEETLRNPPRPLPGHGSAAVMNAATRVAVLGSAPFDVQAALDQLGIAHASVQWFGKAGGRGAKPLASFSASEFQHVIVQVRESPETARMLLAARGCPATLWLETTPVGSIAAALGVLDSQLLARLLYGWGGYAALAYLEDSVRLAALPAEALAFADPCWRAHHPGITQASRPIGDIIQGLVDMPQMAAWETNDLAQLAAAVATNTSPEAPLRSLFVDISNLVMTDAKTGIQRVVRHVLMELLARPPEGFRVEPVYLVRGEAFRYARAFTTERLWPDIVLGEDAPVEFRQGDIFLGLDLAAHLVPEHRQVFIDMRALGVPVHFVVYDILPLLRPDCFDEAGLPTFRAWYEAIADISDGIVAISRTVAGEFKQWLDQALPTRAVPLKLGWFHLGADLAPGAAAGPGDTLAIDDPIPTFLMVGTIEPRKGHAQALAAFELLWARGHDARLAIIGKPGWRMDRLIKRMRQHDEAGKRFIWLERADDDQLVAMYHSSAALLAASEGEGFGLPLIEAAQYGLPVIARDLPIFREVAGEHAAYFDGLEPEAIADAVESWVREREAGHTATSTGIPWITWREATDQLTDVVIGGQWFDTWVSDGRRCFLASDYRADATVGVLDRERRMSGNGAGLLYGTIPFPLGAGSYTLTIRGRHLGGRGRAWVDVVVTRGLWKLASADIIAGGDDLATLRLDLRDDVADLQIRIMVDGEASIAFTRADIAPAG
jgi:glycosyltransferase involved in cell wall biosynthesis